MKAMKIKTLLLSLLLAGTVVDAAELSRIDPEQIQNLQTQQSPLIIDVRTPAEWHATGIIPNSHKLQGFDDNGQFDAARWTTELNKLKSSPDQPVILVCRSGNRSGKIGEILVQQGAQNIYNLNGGIQGWIRSGHSVQAE